MDESRIKEVGPDRACAEWLLRCGAGVKWDTGSDEFLRDYNSLPVGNYRLLHILEVDATDSAVMLIGFPHFRKSRQPYFFSMAIAMSSYHVAGGVNKVRKAIFHRCGYIEDDAVAALGYLKDSLRDLQLSSCGNVTDAGILTLTQMKYSNL